MAMYRVRPGMRFGLAELTWPAVVKLTEAEAAGLLDLVGLCDEDGEQPGGLAEERGGQGERELDGSVVASTGGAGEGRRLASPAGMVAAAGVDDAGGKKGDGRRVKRG